MDTEEQRDYVLRIGLTESEWQRLRHATVSERMTIKDLVSSLIREYLERKVA